MTTKWTGFAACALVLLGAHSACALEMGDLVTQQTQAGMGLEFTLNATREGNEVLVSLRIPKTGKLATMQNVELEVDGEDEHPLLLSPLAATTGPDGVTTVSFQMGQSLVEKCHIDLYTEVTPMFAHYYSVELKGYVTDKKAAAQKPFQTSPSPAAGKPSSSPPRSGEGVPVS